MSAFWAKYRYRRLAWLSPANASFRLLSVLDPFSAGTVLLFSFFVGFRSICWAGPLEPSLSDPVAPCHPGPRHAGAFSAFSVLTRDPDRPGGTAERAARCPPRSRRRRRHSEHRPRKTTSAWPTSNPSSDPGGTDTRLKSAWRSRTFPQERHTRWWCTPSTFGSNRVVPVPRSKAAISTSAASSLSVW